MSQNETAEFGHSQSDIPTAVVLVTISLVSSFGNLLTGMAIWKNAKLRTSTNYLLASLSVADFLQASVALPMRLAQMFSKGGILIIPCSSVLAFTVLFGNTSNVHITLVAVERFIAVIWPYSHCRLVSKKSVLAVSLSAWAFTTAFMVLGFFAMSKVNIEGDVSGICRFTTTFNKEYILSSYILFDIFPLAIVVFVYYFLLKAAYRQTVQIKIQQFALSYSQATINSNLSTEQAGNLTGDAEKACTNPTKNGFKGSQRRTRMETVAQDTSSTNAFKFISLLKFNCETFFIKKAGISTSRQLPHVKCTSFTSKKLQLQLQAKAIETLAGPPERLADPRHDSLLRISLIKDMKAAKIVATLVGVFIILVLPIIVVDVIELVSGPVVPKICVNTAVCLIYANSGVNVFIYCGLNREFRKTFKEICCLKCAQSEVKS